ncbi:MAG TPA: glycoside hydrolase family 15 protein [Polyangiales bacterium]|nr:glycoside hydrolase family 15 protein [Polyangiales bacterium]
MALRIEDYALIGDCRTAALVGRDGSIDWFCPARFDGAACFAALLGTPEHGRWLIAPCAPVRAVRRRYMGETMVLETEFETDEGRVAVIDCMPLAGDAAWPQITRLVLGRSGRVRMQLELVVRFEYGSVVPWVTRGDAGLRATAGPDALYLYSEVPLRGENLRTVADFVVDQGDRYPFSLIYTPSHLPQPAPVAAAYVVERTSARWTHWSARSRYEGPYREQVQRSLLTLKALTYEPTGGMVAAPTTSLPEELGGARNWDYRFCWVRDATITLYALLLSGYTAEAQAWTQWLLRAVAGSPEQLQVIYGISGERRLTEYELDWLPGYAGSTPVRIGNAAHHQLQLDVFGELLDAMHQSRRARMGSRASWALETRLLAFLESNWQAPDSSIWEVRGPARDFTYSKVMAWVAFDRAVKAVEELGFTGPAERWRAVRDRIHQDVCARGWSERKQAFVQAYGGDELDASLLKLPLVGFLPPHDPRVQATVAAIERELLIDRTFVARYRTSSAVDGLPPGEGAFLPCSFWLVNNWVMQGRRGEAQELFERLLDLCNDVGLLSEEYDPRLRRQLGNFPQAFSHLALVDAAQALAGPSDAPPRHRV